MLRLVLAALRYRLAATLALGALAMFAVASAAAIPLYASAADRHILTSAWAQASPADRTSMIDLDKLDDLARIYLELGLDAVVPNVIEGIRANGMEGAPSASRGVFSIAPRSHFSPSPSS